MTPCTYISCPETMCASPGAMSTPARSRMTARPAFRRRRHEHARACEARRPCNQTARQAGYLVTRDLAALAEPPHALAHSADPAVLARRDRHGDWHTRADSVVTDTGGRAVRAQPYRSAHLQLLGQWQLGRKRSCIWWRNHLLLEDRR